MLATAGPASGAAAYADGTPQVAAPRSWHLAATGRWSFGGRPPADATLRAWFRRLARGSGRVIHVSGRGSDLNPGTAKRPLREISAAIRVAVPGDRITVGDGTYGYTEVRGIHGSPSQWLTIMTASARTRARIHVPPPTDNFVNVISSSYVGIYGFEVVGDEGNPNTNGSGISVYGNSHHVAIWKNHVHDFPGGGINCFDVDGSHDLLDISYNVVHDTSRRSPSNTSGISIYAGRDLTRGATFSDGYGYRIVGNYVYDALCQAPFTPGGYDFVTDGNGVSIDSLESAHGYTKPVLVANNVITGCGGRAVLAYRSVNVDMIENIAVGNLRTNSPAITGGVELEGKTDGSVRMLRNVICPLHTPKSTDNRSVYRQNLVLGGRQPVPAGNVDRRQLGLDYFTDVSASDTIAGTSVSVFRASGSAPG